MMNYDHYSSPSLCFVSLEFKETFSLSGRQDCLIFSLKVRAIIVSQLTTALSIGSCRLVPFAILMAFDMNDSI